MSIESNRDSLWRTADGRSVKIKDMTVGHLVNVINWVLDNPDSYPLSIADIMIEEAKYRQTFLFAKGMPYPQQVGSRWRVIDTKTGEGKIERPPQDYIDNVKDNKIYQSMSKRTQSKRRQESL